MAKREETNKMVPGGFVETVMSPEKKHEMGIKGGTPSEEAHGFHATNLEKKRKAEHNSDRASHEESNALEKQE